jgi:thioredoxin-related protein
MKRYIVTLSLISALVWAWCSFGLAGETSKAASTEANTKPVNLSAEIARAKAENKLLLLEFGSSDACPPCILFQREVFSKPEFQAFEKSNLVFVRIDFPFKTELPPEVQNTNSLLAQQFEAYMYPTFIALDRDGKEFWRMPKQGEMTLDTNLFRPENFIKLIKSLDNKEK